MGKLEVETGRKGWSDGALEEGIFRRRMTPP